MKLVKNNKGLAMGGKVAFVMTVIVTIVVLLQLLANTAGDLGNAASNMTSTRLNADYAHGAADTLPLTSLFARGGVIFLMLMAGVFIAVFMYIKHRRL